MITRKKRIIHGGPHTSSPLIDAAFHSTFITWFRRNLAITLAVFAWVSLLGFSANQAHADDFFKIHKITQTDKPPKVETSGTWFTPLDGRFDWKKKVFVPYLTAVVQTDERYASANVIARAHFFDQKNELIATVNEPASAWRARTNHYAMPTIFPKQRKYSLLFPIPKEAVDKDWKVMIVFGDAHGASGMLYPLTASSFGMKYPEQALVESAAKSLVKREIPEDPVISCTVELKGSNSQKITLFVRPPEGVDHLSKAKGVLALCILASNPRDIQGQMLSYLKDDASALLEELKVILQPFPSLSPELRQTIEERLDDVPPGQEGNVIAEIKRMLPDTGNGAEAAIYAERMQRISELEAKIQLMRLLRLADEHQLAVLAWSAYGVGTAWNPKMSYDELSKKENKIQTERFDLVADAWEKAILQLNKTHGLPIENYLVWGFSAAAQYSLRLALHKSQYFLAVHAHIPSSFDKPPEKGRRTLWLLTTGEREGGYPSAQRFYNECRKLGYPMVFKGLPGKGHQLSHISDNLGIAFFEYALSLKEERRAILEDAKGKTFPLGEVIWPQSFRNPEFLGDYLNQDVYPASVGSGVSSAYQVRLPNEKVASAWKN